MRTHELSHASAADALLTDWDILLAAVSTRLQQITGTIPPADPQTIGALVDCAEALERLRANLVDEDERRHQLDLALFDLRMAMAMHRGTAS